MMSRSVFEEYFFGNDVNVVKCRSEGDYCRLNNFITSSTRYKGVDEVQEFIKKKCFYITGLHGSWVWYVDMLCLCESIIEQWVTKWYLPWYYKAGSRSRWCTSRVKQLSTKPMVNFCDAAQARSSCEEYLVPRENKFSISKVDVMVNSFGIDTDASEFTSKEVNTRSYSSTNRSGRRDLRPVSG